MNEPESGSGGGWTVGRVLGLIVGLIGMAGFGLCGLCGLMFGVSSGSRGSDLAFILGCAVAGLLIASAFFMLARAMTRRAQRKPPDAS